MRKGSKLPQHTTSLISGPAEEPNYGKVTLAIAIRVERLSPMRSAPQLRFLHFSCARTQWWTVVTIQVGDSSRW